ncbi:glycosyltransferase [Dyella sp. RRB7]|uniref:glycosyltransferase n=1 Tax=Dyella sp. RRB7 TaxID=2919502 RepID=UPI001FAA3E9B|nr:glycosyltransferase [Dyella sp. RRB7]
MRIVIDLQGAQSESRHRGIGRHTDALVKAFVREAAGKHEVWIATNANLGHVEAIRGAFGEMIPPSRIVSFAIPGHAAAMHPANRRGMEVGELLREDFLRGLNPDVVWCSSLFEGWLDDSVTSIGRLPTSATQAVTLYDLIPLSDKQEHLGDPAVRSWYYRKLSQLQRADLLLAISEYAREEAIELLNIAPERTYTISSAADSRFRQLADKEKRRFRDSSGLNAPFVLYVGGFDGRKNVELLVRAFADMPRDLRSQHTLVLGGKITATQEAALRSLASSLGLGMKDVVFTGKLTDEDLVALYNLCSLFVFPSLQEGFGLPVLEAMACGAPVLAANATSIPEVVRHEDMLFSPTEASGLASKMAVVLRDRTMSEAFRAHGLTQAKRFSWESSAQRVMEAFESRVRSAMRVRSAQSSDHNSVARPRLAFVSPLPPERTGIADYSVELLPSLERYYDIDVVVDQKTVDDPWVRANYPVRDASWFRANAHRFDRVLYQFGNSAFHLYQLELMREIPGAVVLHDSFIGALSQWRAARAGGDREYLQRLYRAHGYCALLADRANGRAWSVQNYPSSWEVLESAAGVLVHSQYAIDQAGRFYGPEVASEMRRVAFPKRRRASTRETSRKALGLQSGDFVVCSFGMVAPTKLNHRLLSAWLKSPLASDERCHLVFVGENHGGDYGNDLLTTLRGSLAADRIRITGFVDHEHYHAWLEAADLAVQLRTESRGETSAAVYDCMAQSLPVVVNAHATFAELDPDAVCMLPDAFDDAELSATLQALYGNPDKRRYLSDRARYLIDTRHHPAAVAAEYHSAIEDFASSHFLAREQELSHHLVAVDGLRDEQLWSVAVAMRGNRAQRGRRKLFVDVTAVVRSDLKTGIERVTRNIARELLGGSFDDVCVELVRFHEGHYVYCREYACHLLGLDDLGMPEEIIEVSPGDIFFGLDWVADVVPGNQALFQYWRDRGALVYFLVYDLLPVLRPDFFPAGIDRMHGAWLKSIASCADGVICISKTVARELKDWLSTQDVLRNRPLHIGYSYLGAELDAGRAVEAATSRQLSTQVLATIERMRSAPTMLMVGTIEPRKGHRLALQAFERLWTDGQDVNLVIVGKLGWMMDAFGEQLRSHPEHGNRLHWLTGIDDQELRALYQAAAALLVASEGEGFGLPIIEAALHGIPVITRDLPVFREVAGDNAHYFPDGDAEGLRRSILEWLLLKRSDVAPSSVPISPLSWRESAQTIWAMLTETSHSHWLYHKVQRSVVGPHGLVLDLAQASSELLLQGWSSPESWGCWAVGPLARLKVSIQPPNGSGMKLSLVARAFVCPSHPRQTFELHVNDEPLGSWVHEYGEDVKELHWIIPPERFLVWSSLELTVIQRDVIAPNALGQSSDDRLLGLAVKEFAFSWVSPEEPARLC